VLSKKKLPVSETEYLPDKVFRISPNPADKELFFSFKNNQDTNDLSLFIYDLTGRTIRSLSKFENPVFVGDLRKGYTLSNS